MGRPSRPRKPGLPDLHRLDPGERSNLGVADPNPEEDPIGNISASSNPKHFASSFRRTSGMEPDPSSAAIMSALEAYRGSKRDEAMPPVGPGDRFACKSLGRNREQTKTQWLSDRPETESACAGGQEPEPHREKPTGRRESVQPGAGRAGGRGGWPEVELEAQVLLMPGARLLPSGGARLVRRQRASPP